jgi:serine/threonine protein kinase
LAVWQRLDHKNVLPVIAVIRGSQYLPNIVYGYMSNGASTPHNPRLLTTGLGTVLEFISRNPDAPRFSIISAIADGLCYLHGMLCHLAFPKSLAHRIYLKDNHIVHGDIKAVRVFTL